MDQDTMLKTTAEYLNEKISYSYKELNFKTMDEAFRKAEEIYNKGKDHWEILPSSRIETAEYGFYLFRSCISGKPLSSYDFKILTENDLSNIIEEGYYITWPMFDEKFTTGEEITLKTVEEMLSFLDYHPDAIIYDKPIKLLVGFAFFDIINHSVTTRQIRIVDIKKSSLENSEKFLNIRQSKMEEKIKILEPVNNVINMITGGKKPVL